MFRIAQLLRSLQTLATGLRCPGCARAAAQIPCPMCRTEVRVSPSAPNAAFRDAGPIGRMVRSAKHGEWRGGARVLAALVVEERLARIPECDVVTWVPADPRRRAVRGGHLPERVARELAGFLGVPAVPLLQPVRRRRPQRGLDRDARRRNVAGAFRLAVPRHRIALPAGARVLVVDDVRTTGATLAAACAALADRFDARSFAVVGVDNQVGVGSNPVRKYARSADYQLTNRTGRADVEEHVTRKDPVGLTAPRPP